LLVAYADGPSEESEIFLFQGTLEVAARRDSSVGIEVGNQGSEVGMDGAGDKITEYRALDAWYFLSRGAIDKRLL
jgi:hypothetical protein